MKKIILLVFLLLPAITYAGGHKESAYTSPFICDSRSSALSDSPAPTKIINQSHDKQTPAPVIPASIPTPTAPAPVVTPTPAGNPTPSGGGGGTQIYCSSPTATGWHVDLPGGGCGTTTTISTPVPGTVTVIHLNQLPYTGAPGWYLISESALIAFLLTVLIFISKYFLNASYTRTSETEDTR